MRARDRYGLGQGIGPEVRWNPERPERKKRPKSKRPRRARRKLPKPTGVCVHPLCAHRMAEPVAPGRTVCASCAERLDRLATGLREREQRRTVADTSAPASVGADPGHDQGGTPDA